MEQSGIIMAVLNIDTEKVLGNINKINSFLSQQNIQWTLVTKVLGGYKPVLEKILNNDSIKNIHSIGDARTTNLKAIKEVAPDVVTMYIKPPPLNQIKNVIQYADISVNSSLHTLEELNKEAGNKGKIHRIIIMIEMGELREGILRDNILQFYEKAFSLQNLEIIGIGTNLGCMYGVEPTYDKLIQLSLYKELINAKFGKKLELVSGGSSITLPLVSMKKVPAGVNHFRIGESAFFGVSPLDNKKFKNLSDSVFDFAAEILEIEKKGNMPDGVIGEASVGHTADINSEKYEESYRAILDFGEIDVDVKNLKTKDETINFAGTTSDMTVFDIGKKLNEYKVGGKIHFNPNYMAVARLMNSRYMRKNVY